jgi:hypothetical protein
MKGIGRKIVKVVWTQEVTAGKAWLMLRFKQGVVAVAGYWVLS